MTVRRALVTGVTGQDGGYLAERLVHDGWLVVGTARPGEAVPAHLRALGDRIEIEQLDLRDLDSLTALVRRVEPDETYNLAGISSVAWSWQDPVTTMQVNAVAVAGLLDALRRQQDRTGRPARLLQASSGEIFAGAEQVPQRETTRIAPRSPYGAAKACAHHMLQVHRASSGVHGVNVILYNHESPRRSPLFVTRKITSTVVAIAEGRESVLSLGNLDSRRDWGWAPEYVDAMVRAIRHDQPDDYIVATGVSHSVADFVEAAFLRCGISDWRPYVRVDPDLVRAADPVELVGDASYARSVLGWEPKVAFADVVGRMVDADRTS